MTTLNPLTLTNFLNLTKSIITRNDLSSSEIRGLAIKLSYDQISELIDLLSNSPITDTVNALQIKLRIKRAKLTLQDLITRQPILITENQYRLSHRWYGDLLCINSPKDLRKALRVMDGNNDNNYYLRSLSPAKLRVSHTNVEFYYEC